jgi:hypothetical protein
MKQYIILTDMFHSVQILYFRDDDNSLHCIAKDFDDRVLLHAEVMSDCGKLGVITADDRAHVQLFQPNFR